MDFKDKKTKNFMIGIVGALLVVIGCAVAVQALTEDQYSIYKLNGQHIGTIEDGDKVCDNCLIFDVNQMSYYGKTSFPKQDMFEQINYGTPLYCNSDEGPATLYFAKEGGLRADLEDGDYIVVRWVRIGAGGYHIRGVWAWDDFLRQEC